MKSFILGFHRFDVQNVHQPQVILSLKNQVTTIYPPLPVKPHEYLPIGTGLPGKAIFMCVMKGI